MPKHLREDSKKNSKSTPKPNQLPTHAPSLDHYSIKKASLIFRAINHKLRQDIVKFIDNKAHVTVTQIFVEMRLEQSVASQHLAILRRAGIVITEREGKFMYYKLNMKRLALINQMVTDLLK